MPHIGVNFSPTQTQAGTGGGFSPAVQDAIQLLSFRMPSNVGGSAAAPAAIMGGATALGPQLGNAVAEQWLRRLFQGQALPGGGGPQGAPGFAPSGVGGLGSLTGALGGFGGGGMASGSASQPPALSGALPVNVAFGGRGPGGDYLGPVYGSEQRDVMGAPDFYPNIRNTSPNTPLPESGSGGGSMPWNPYPAWSRSGT